LEAAMGGSGIEEERVTQLADVTQPVDGGGVDHGQRFGIETDVVPERVADDLEPGHDGCLGGNPIPVVPRPRPRRAPGPGTERSSPGTSARAAPPGHRTPPGELRSRSEEHTSELQSRGHLVCRLLLEKKNLKQTKATSNRVISPL